MWISYDELQERSRERLHSKRQGLTNQHGLVLSRQLRFLRLRSFAHFYPWRPHWFGFDTWQQLCLWIFISRVRTDRVLEAWKKKTHNLWFHSIHNIYIHADIPHILCPSRRWPQWWDKLGRLLSILVRFLSDCVPTLHHLIRHSKGVQVVLKCRKMVDVLLG